MPNQTVKKDQITPNEFFSQKATNKIFMYLLAPFILQDFFKNFQADPQNVLGTNHYFHFHLPTGPFHYAKFKKILTADPEL